MTGVVYSKKEILVSNKISKDARYDPSVDSIASQSVVYNIMICPIVDEYFDLESVKVAPNYESEEFGVLTSVKENQTRALLGVV